MEHPNSAGFGLFHGSTWAWSFFSDRFLNTSNGPSNGSLCFVNEATSRMTFALSGDRSQANVYGGLWIGGEAPNLNFNAPPQVPAGSIHAAGMMRPGSFTVATVPSPAGNAGAMIYVSNESGGATMAFSDGAHWRRVHDRQIIS